MKSLEELKAIRERMQGQVGLRSEAVSYTHLNHQPIPTDLQKR